MVNKNTNEFELTHKCANCGGDHLVNARSCESWKLVKEIQAGKREDNIPYYEAWKIVAGSMTTTYHMLSRGVVVIVVGNGHGDTSSNPGRDWLQFT